MEQVNDLLYRHVGVLEHVLGFEYYEGVYPLWS